MKQKDREKWAKTREKGLKRFIWRNGMLGWGLPTGMVVFIIDLLDRSIPLTFFKIATTFGIIVILSCFFGATWAMFMWKMMERLYNKAQ